jgi:hypothetical protein
MAYAQVGTSRSNGFSQSIRCDKKSLRRLTKLREFGHRLKPGGNATFSHSSSGKFEIDIRRRSCHQITRVQ